MAVCTWCSDDMTTSRSCSVEAFHRDGRRYDMIPFGAEPGWSKSGGRCGDCGVQRGGWHHPGCDIQRVAMSGCRRHPRGLERGIVGCDATSETL